MIASNNEMWMDRDGSIRVNGNQCIGQGTTAKTYTNNLTSGYSTGGDDTFVVKKDYYADCADYGITIDTEYIENVCRKIYGKIDVCKEKDEVDDVIVPPMKGFIEI